MIKYLLFSLVAINLIGCASSPEVAMPKDQYCYTDQTIVKKDNTNVQSVTRLECSDNPLKRAKIVGVDEKNCRRWERRDEVNGHLKVYGGYICRDEKNNWRPLSQY